MDQDVGRRVRERRTALRISQVSLGEHLGVTFQQVQKYEKGTNRLSASMLVRTAELLEVSVSDLIGEARREARGAREMTMALRTDGVQELLELYSGLSDEARTAVRQLTLALAGLS